MMSAGKEKQASLTQLLSAFAAQSMGLEPKRGQEGQESLSGHWATGTGEA